MFRRVALVGLLATLPLVALAAQPQFWRIEGAREFLEGETDGLSVDSEGRVRLAPASKVLHDPEAPYVWCLTRDDKGTIYAGTGNDGRVYKIEGDKTAVFYDAAELEVHALAIGPDGRLYVGTAPDGKVYAVDKAGLVETFYDPTDKYIWALAFDHKGNLLVATGAEGRIHRVDSKGKGQIAFTSSETHITSLTVDAKDNVYAGSAPGGIVYRLDPALKVFVLYDSPYREVKALDVSADGSVYAALVEGKDREDAARPPLPQPPAVPTGDVTITETFSVGPLVVPSPPPAPRMGEPARPGAAKGAVLRILPTGELETLWSSSDEMPHALAWAEGGVFVGTGNKGKLYRIKDERTWTMVASFPSEQVTALRRDAAGAFLLATSNPGRVYRLEGTPGTKGTFTSKPRDTDTVSSWGRLRWEAEIPTGGEIQIATRSGNTSTPDSTWTDWSPAYTRKEGDPVTSERARFLQIRAVLTGKSGASPLLDSVTTAYLQRNLRPQLQSVTIHPPGEIFQKPISVTGEIEILGLDPGEGADIRPTGAPPKANPALAAITAYSRKLYQKGIQTFSWKAEDANTDTLVYDVSYRLVNDTRFRLLRKSLTDAVLAWDTSTVPNGRYIIKVTAWDTPGNPAALALSGEKESDPFDVDNAPPVVTATISERKPLRIRAVARDDTSMIRKADYSVDGGRWQEVHPQDGINDSVEETYEIVLGELQSQAPHIVVVRATDQLGNVSTARVEIP